MKVEITELPKAVVLLALYNNAKQAFIHDLDSPANPEKAESAILAASKNHDYYFSRVNLGSGGRLIEVDLSGYDFDATLYDQNHGYEGYAAKIINQARTDYINQFSGKLELTPPLIVKYTISEDISEKLNKTYPFEILQKHQENMSNLNINPNPNPNLVFYRETPQVLVNSDYTVSLLGVNSTKLEERNALTSAFSAAIPGIERVLNKKLWGTHRIQMSVILYYVQPSQSFSMSWHYDGNYPITSLVYFHHQGVNATLSFRLRRSFESSSSDITNAKNIPSISTRGGDCITFADQVLQHRVHDIMTTEKPAIRGVMTFFYKGPSGIPASLKESVIPSAEIVEDTRNNETVISVTSFRSM